MFLFAFIWEKVLDKRKKVLFLLNEKVRNCPLKTSIDIFRQILFVFKCFSPYVNKMIKTILLFVERDLRSPISILLKPNFNRSNFSILESTTGNEFLNKN